METFNKLHIRTVIVWAFLVISTALSICIIYGWGSFSKSPLYWIRTSMLMSTLTCLWIYALWFECLARGFKSKRNLLLFVFLAFPFNFILVYPAFFRQFLEFSKIDFIYVFALIIALEVIHGTGFYIIQREVKQVLQDKNILENKEAHT
jgi:hypothetical protein